MHFILVFLILVILGYFILKKLGNWKLTASLLAKKYSQFSIENPSYSGLEIAQDILKKRYGRDSVDSFFYVSQICTGLNRKFGLAELVFTCLLHEKNSFLNEDSNNAGLSDISWFIFKLEKISKYLSKLGY